MILAITLDLDDTLWPITPAIAAAEAALQAWMRLHCPLASLPPVEDWQALRERLCLESPHLSHDFSALRRATLRSVLLPAGYGEREVELAFEAFFSARNRVSLFPEVGDSLRRLAARWPLASVTNGNADLVRIGLAHHFKARICPLTARCAKPDVRIFLDAARALSLPPHHIAHVGDDPDLDVRGAQQAGMCAVWLNRTHAEWPYAQRPDIEIQTLDQLEHALTLWNGQANGRLP